MKKKNLYRNQRLCTRLLSETIVLFNKIYYMYTIIKIMYMFYGYE